MVWKTLLACSALALLIGRAAAADDLSMQFLRALRERGYYDYALVYLDKIAARTDLPAETRQVLPYERAMTLNESSRQLRNPERQLELLDQAAGFLDQFVKESPDHPLAADANSERANILLSKGEVDILQSRSPSNAGTKGTFQTRARQLITQARDIFATAAKQHEEAMKKYPPHIDKERDPDQYAAREAVETRMLTALLKQSMCTYHEAQTYDGESPERKRLLGEAANSFEGLAQRYRSMGVGLYARMYQGKCFEEQGDLQKAIGIYNELLGHEGNEGALATVKPRTQLFRLVCLNAKTPPDNQLVIDEAEKWLKEHKAETRGADGLGIQWELARACEMLGDRRTQEPADAERLWKQARTAATAVNKYPGEYKDLGLAMIQRLEVKLGGKGKKPEKFDTAFGLGRLSFDRAQDLRKELDGAATAGKPAEEIKKLQTDFDNEIQEAARMLELGTQLANSQDDFKSVNTARLMLAYCNYYLRRNYESAVLATFVARTSHDDGPLALDSAYFALQALTQAYNEAAGREVERDGAVRLVIEAANLITKRWPNNERANDARIALGSLYARMGKPAEAAKWYEQVPDSDPKFASARLEAGQAYWRAYATAARMAADQRPAADVLVQYQTQARSYLETGIQKLSTALPKESLGSPELIQAKVYLAAILINQGQEAAAIQVITGDPQSVIKAVAVDNEAARPPAGVQSRNFASDAYKQLMRAQIGAGQTDAARETMSSLEKIVGGQGGADLTLLYVNLGRLLRDELDRFRATGETDRFNKLMTSFETFLGDVSQRKEGQNFGSLNWIAETYYALGEASSADSSKSANFYQKSKEALESVASQAAANPSFATSDQLLASKIRLSRAERALREFQTAEKLIGEVLSTREKDLSAQFEAAKLYMDWGADGADPQKRLKQSLNGNREIKSWGWGQLGQRLQVSISRSQKPELRDSLVDARINAAITRMRLAQTEKDAAARKAEYQRSRGELQGTVVMLPNITDEEYVRMNNTYREVLTGEGVPVTDMSRSPVLAAAAEKPAPSESAAEGTESTTPKPSAKPKAVVAEKPKAGNSSLVMIIVTLLALAGIGGMVYMMVKPKPKKKAFTTTGKGGSFGAPAVPGTQAARPSAPRPARPAGSSTGAPPGTAAAPPRPRPAGTRPTKPPGNI